ncbi:hypothetical protein EZV62_001485 [Acer yangbiense]|uniref:HAT C-terminal dimerisation domain-containing protein n=1 Tax=Acer yangbiense TaxID=1000413 RepID=A0A5C7IWM0_9ROSI|nr:hypothetical protein EZV62_001485 [Acer yangbiense]
MQIEFMDIQENPPIDVSNESGDELTKTTTPKKNGKTGTGKRKKRSPAWNSFEDFDICYKESSVSMKTEIHKYFDDERLDRKKELDVLTWWKGQQTRYPILSHLACDVLTIPISTVASESAFSIGGRVLDQYRSSLSPDTVQALMKMI